MKAWWFRFRIAVKSLIPRYRRVTMAEAPAGHDWRPEVGFAPDPTPYGTYPDERESA